MSSSHVMIEMMIWVEDLIQVIKMENLSQGNEVPGTGGGG
jgi:hypothetical protein